MPTWEFHLVLKGDGDNAEEAWNDAVEHFQMDPGEAPEDAEEV